MSKQIQTTIGIRNALRTTGKVRQLTPEQLEIPIDGDDKDEEQSDIDIWGELYEWARTAAEVGEVGVAARTEDGHISSAFPIREGRSHEIHALELAVWKAYSEREVPVTEVAIVTDNRDFSPCGRCRQVVSDYSSGAEVRSADRQGDNWHHVLPEEETPQRPEPSTVPAEEAIEDGSDTEESVNTDTTPEGQSEQLEVEYIRFETPVYHYKYKDLHTTFCNRDLKGLEFRRSNQEPDLLDPCKSCTGESRVQTIEEQMEDLRSEIREQVPEVTVDGLDPGHFDAEELGAILDAIPTEFHKFERSPETIRFKLSRAVEEINDSETAPKSFEKGEMEAMLAAIEGVGIVPRSPHLFVITESNKMKRVSLSEFQTQGRGGKGTRVTPAGEGDEPTSMFVAIPRDHVLLFTDHGNVYKLNGCEIPHMTTSEGGTPLTEIIPLDEGESVEVAIPMTDDDHEFLAIVTRKGYIKRTKAEEFDNILSTGIIAIDLEDDELRDVKWTDGNSDIIIGSRGGQTIRFDESQVRPMGRTARGVKGIDLTSGDGVTGMSVIDPEEESQILSVTKNGYGKRTDADDYRPQSRGGRGLKDIAIDERNGSLVDVETVTEEEHLVVLNSDGHLIHTPVSGISSMGRNTKGVIIMNLNDDDSVIGWDIVPVSTEVS
ncbi:DNA gyrase C-terminal beta-propeller domain-containing protein [Haladaptatus sp. SPP-AMP-3]|uniref:DNA gyrase C-terminal beta-propeller domain-containing protein n=1 Tax=Haladaptatus sp. SPP-AMP-3 TaxID=3121295 RepID=UPI003C2B9E8C